MFSSGVIVPQRFFKLNCSVGRNTLWEKHRHFRVESLAQPTEKRRWCPPCRFRTEGLTSSTGGSAALSHASAVSTLGELSSSLILQQLVLTALSKELLACQSPFWRAQILLIVLLLFFLKLLHCLLCIPYGHKKKFNSGGFFLVNFLLLYNI